MLTFLKKIWSKIFKSETEVTVKVTRKKKVAVVQLSKEGVQLAIFESVYAASKATGVDAGSISRNINELPGHKSAGGFIWKKA